MSVHSSSTSSHNKNFYYRITRNLDKNEIEFNPPKDSQVLRNALSHRFPHLDNHESRLQAAIAEFFEEEGNPLVPISSEFNDAWTSPVHNDARPSPTVSALSLTRHSSNASSKTSLACSTQSKKTKRSRRKLYPRERVEVLKNRGKVCEKHREQKVKCDPKVCPDNGLFHSYQRPAASASSAHTDITTSAFSPDTMNAPTFPTKNMNEFASSENDMNVFTGCYGIPASAYSSPVPPSLPQFAHQPPLPNQMWDNTTHVGFENHSMNGQYFNQEEPHSLSYSPLSNNSTTTTYYNGQIPPHLILRSNAEPVVQSLPHRIKTTNHFSQNSQHNAEDEHSRDMSPPLKRQKHLLKSLKSWVLSTFAKTFH